ncbi:MAG: beta-N-acetylhexosaminidase [Rhodospirillales bacterium]|nr:beta-N-acetylhexosaminidase [Rhodospirillales bacterium]
MTAPRSVVFGLAGPALGAEERNFFRETDPLGFILFARNVEFPDQVGALVASLREAVGREAPVLIDQEGGRVQRLRAPHWREAPPAARFGDLFARDPARAEEAVRLNHRLFAADLAQLGITVDCAPVLDVPVEGAHDVIGNRAVARDPAVVAALGGAAVAGLLAGGVIPVVKHIPGHGRAFTDSHQELPKVDAALAELEAGDFAPFKALKDAPWAMTAHVLYLTLDSARPATQSPAVIELTIRRRIGFGGVLVSDDLGMSALQGDFPTRAAACLAAGCDGVLHCSGNMAEMRAVADGVGRLNNAAQDRLASAETLRLKSRAPFDAREDLARLDALLAGT